MDYWLHRITGGENALPLSSALFDKGFLSIGWSDFSKESYLAEIRSGMDAFNAMFNREWGYLPPNRNNLWRFVIGMKPGDYVIVPFPYRFTVCEILDDVVYTNETIDETLLVDWNGAPVKRDEKYVLRNSGGNYIDLGFYRRIKVVEPRNIPREYANQDLYSRMKIRQTNAGINGLKASVELALERWREKRPINLRGSILEETRSTVLNLIRTLYNDGKFEELVEKYLYSVGASRVEKPSKNESPTEEGDADRVGYFDKIGIAIMVQAKKHKDNTNSWAVNQIKAYKKNHPMSDATVLWVISTCDAYDETAQRLAQEENVRLINGLEFVDMLLDAGLQGIG